MKIYKQKILAGVLLLSLLLSGCNFGQTVPSDTSATESETTADIISETTTNTTPQEDSNIIQTMAPSDSTAIPDVIIDNSTGVAASTEGTAVISEGTSVNASPLPGQIAQTSQFIISDSPDYIDLSKNINEAGFELFYKTTTPKKTNQIISPPGVYDEIMMIYNGAGGKTKTELGSYLGIIEGQPLISLNFSIQTLTESYMNDKSLKGLYFKTGNVYVFDDSFESRHIYTDNARVDILMPIKSAYCTVENKDLQSEESTSYINGTITQAMNKTSILTNTYYSDAVDVLAGNYTDIGVNWTYWFDPDNNINKMFYGAYNDTEVETMQQVNNFKYIETNKIKGLEISCDTNNDLVFDIFMANNYYDNILELFENADKDKLFYDLNKAEPQLMRLYLPKFETESSQISLTNALNSSGYGSAFAPGADYSSIASNMYIGECIHKTKIIIKEDGMNPSPYMLKDYVDKKGKNLDKKMETFEVDMPFVYCIRDKRTGVILAIGNINNLG